MNERFIELMTQCREPAENEVNMEKFADLIVKECIAIAHAEGDNVAYLADYFEIKEWPRYW